MASLTMRFLAGFLAFAGVLLGLAVNPARAHPHVWIDATLGFEVEGGRITAIQVTWLFDDFYSSLVQQDFDLDGDGTLSQTELDALVGVSAVNLKEFSFFTHLKVNGEKHPVQAVREFYAEDRDGQILYRFKVPLPTPVDPHDTPVSVGVFDESYYIAIELPEKEITIDPASGCQVALRKDMNEPLYYGTFFPTYAMVECTGG